MGRKVEYTPEELRLRVNAVKRAYQKNTSLI